MRYKHHIAAILVLIGTGIGQVNAQVVSASATASVTSGCSPLSVSFNNTSAGSTSYSWDFGNGGTSILANPSAVYFTPGNYTVRLIANGTSGTSDTLFMINIIDVLDNPISGFTYNQTGNCVNNNSVEFINTSFNATQYLWDFGDGASSSDISPNHQYSAAGFYTVTLLASNSSCSDVFQMTSSILIDPLPTVDFTVDSNQACGTNYSYQFTDITLNNVVSSWQFGDGTIGTASSVSHMYSSLGLFDVTLLSTNSSGCVNSLTKTSFIENITGMPISFSSDDPLLCIDDTVNFLNTSSAFTQSAWDFGDGYTSLLANPMHSYSSSGIYPITLAIIDSNGCPNLLTDSTYIQVYEDPIADFSASTNFGCAGDIISFINSSTGVASYLWSFGDGTTSTAENPMHVYNTSGSFFVNLWVVSPGGCEDLAQTQVVMNILESSFSIDEFNGCAPLTVLFSDSSLGATTWFWDFGDGITSNQQHPSHTYVSDSIYDVTLITSNGIGCFDTLLMSSLIYVVTDSLNIILSDTSLGCLPYPVDFSNNVIGNYSWLWDFGDGTTSSNPLPTHVYTVPGTYTVSLSTQTANGCYLYISNYSTFVIEDFTAGFTALAVDCSTLTVAFQDTSSSGSSWFWNFGDGTTSNQQNPVHVFTDSSSHDIFLTVISPTGCMSNILVNNFIDFSSCTINGGAVPPVGMFEPAGGVSDSLVNLPGASFATCSPINVYLHSPFPNATSWFWDFGDGTTSTDEHTYHLYLAAGIFDIILIAQSSTGPDTLILDNFVELIGPVANFSSAIDYNCSSNSVQFTDLSANGNTWSWNFGDGTTSNINSPMHSFLSNDIIVPVSLFVTDTNGCSSSYSTLLSFMSFDPEVIFEDSICLGNSVEFTPLDTVNYTYYWDFGDGNTSSNSAPEHEYLSAGTFPIQVVVSHNLGCTKSLSLPDVTVINIVQDFIVTDSTKGCPGDSFTFTPTNMVADYFGWHIAQEDIYGVASPTIVLENSGFYSAILYTRLGTCLDTVVKAQYIEVWDLNSNFTVSQIEFCDPYLYELNNTSTNAFTYSWIENGSNILGGANVFASSSADSVIFRLAITDIHGCVDTSSSLIYPESISTDFTSTTTDGCVPHLVDFTGSSENAATWLWHFGDGTTSNLESPSHTYLVAGTYDVMLIATSSTGHCSDTVLFTNYIHTSSPLADFTLLTSFSCAPMVVNFTDASLDAISWDWDFGDGAYSTIQNPLHVYTTPGYFDITLTVHDANGCSHSKVITNAVFVPGSIADFTTSTTSLCDSGVIQFNDLSIGANTWNWIFGDGYSSSLQNPNHSYSTGFYTVALIVEDTMGCITSLVLDSLVSIYETPNAAFSLLDSVGCVSYSPVMTNLSTGHDNELWDMGDGNQYNTLPIPYSYANAGTYNITVTTSVANLCFDSTSHAILAIGLSDATIDPVADLCEQNGSFVLTAADIGGAWTGPGISNASTGNFDPSIAGVGVHTIYYEIIGTCGDIDSIQINIIALEDASILSVNTHCGSVTPFNLTSPGSGIWSGVGIVDSLTGLFDPTVSGNGNFTVIHTTTNGICSDQDSIVLQIAPQLDASFMGLAPMCDNSGHKFFIANHPGGIWSGPGIVNVALGEFDPIIAGAGIHNITYSLVGTCGDTLTKTVTVNETPIATITSSPTSGCSIHDVQFFGTSGIIYSYSWEFGAGDTSSIQNPNITFGPGLHDVQLIVTANGCSDTASMQSMIVVHDSIPSVPEINRVTVTGDNSIRIEWKESVDPAFNEYVLYRENINTGLFEQIHIENLVATTSFVDYGVNTLTNSHCYKLIETDICGNEISIVEAIAHCTVNIDATVSGKHHVDVSWSPYVGASISGYELYRCVDTDTTLYLVATVDSITLKFTDPTSYCNLQYSYKVKALNVGGTTLNSWSDSARVYGEGIEDEQISNIIRATVLNDESVWIEWTVPEVGSDFIDSYHILRSTDSLSFVSLGNVAGNIQGFEDLEVEVMDERYYYKIEVINQCPATNSIGEIGTSILLQSEKISETKGLLNWTPYQGWKDGVDTYQIQVLNEFDQWVTVKVVDGKILNSTVDF